MSTYLDKLVPPGAHDDWVLRVWAEPHARNPLSMALFGNGELAIAQGVPQLDGTVSRAGDDLTVVGGEGDGGHRWYGRRSGGSSPQWRVPTVEGSYPRRRREHMHRQTR